MAERLVGFEERWKHIAKWESLSTEDRQKIQRGIEKAYGGRVDELRKARNERLIKELTIADEGPTGGWPGDLTMVRPPEPRKVVSSERGSPSWFGTPAYRSPQNPCSTLR